MKQWQTIQIPLSQGVDNKSDRRASDPPQFDNLRDAEWERVQGIQTRKPYATIGTGIYGGGNLSSIRRIVENGDELLCFTDVGLYSWSPALSLWVLKSEYLAVKTAEATTFATNGDQLDADRAELNNTIVFCWTSGGIVYVAAQDKTTGAATMPPTAVATGAGVGTRPRLVALATKILLFWHDGTDAAPSNLRVLAIDPASVLASVLTAAAIVIAAGVFGSYYDVCKVDGLDQAVFAARRVVTTSYTVGTIDAGLTIASSVKARTCVMPIAVASTPGGLTAQVIRSNAGALQGDQVTLIGLADTANINTAVGSYAAQLNQLTCAFRSVKTAGVFRCYAFWSYNEADNATNWQSSYNFVTDAGAVGAEGVFIRRLGVASRAFDYNGRVFVWMVFAGASSFAGANLPGYRAQLQNSYFLYRDTVAAGLDPLLCAKAAFSRAGGFCPSIGRLPGVALTSGTSGFSWCATERRIVDLSTKQTGYDARAPRDVTFTFDSNEARRTARIGQTLYITGGEVLQYDGTGLYEVGFHVYPFHFGGFEAVGGTMVNGLYNYKMTHRWDNAKGERERSTTATVAQYAIAAGPSSIVIAGAAPLYVTHKLAPRPPAEEIWRTQANPAVGAPFSLATGLDPAVIANPNGYRANDNTISTLGSWSDYLTDASLSTHEANPENGAVLENLAPPAATIIIASADRLFLAGVAGDPNRIWYSKLRADGQVAAFHDTLTVSVPAIGGVITGLAFLNETLIVFKETAIYALAGDGLDNLGGGQNYGPARMLSSDAGATVHESIVLTPMGLVFKSSKGWYLLNRGWSTDYIGSPVCNFDNEPVLAVQIVESQHQVRALSASRMLVFDYNPNPAVKWCEWTISNAVSSALYGGVHYYATLADVKAQRSDYVGIDYGLAAELAWIKLNDLQGAGSIRWFSILGENRGVHSLRIRLARDYEQDGTNNWVYYQDETWTPEAAALGFPERVRVGPSIPKCMAIKIRITVVAKDGVWSEGTKLTGIALDVGIDKGINSRLPAAQKA